GRDKERIQGVIDAWYPKALDMFGNTGSRRSERYRHWGLKRRTNAQAREEYMREVDPLIRAMGLTVPDPTVGREFIYTRAPSTSTWRRWSWRSMPRSTARCPTSRTTRRSWIRRSATARRSWRSSSTATWRVGSREHRRLRQDRPARLGDDPDRSRHEADHQDGRQPGAGPSGRQGRRRSAASRRPAWRIGDARRHGTRRRDGRHPERAGHGRHRRRTSLGPGAGRLRCARHVESAGGGDQEDAVRPRAVRDGVE